MTSVIPSIPSSVTVVDREEQQQRRADGSGARGEMRVRTRSEKLAEEMGLDIDVSMLFVKCFLKMIKLKDR
eukprot:CAMPEP_0114405084 /NCGR_PEP_ID=MMETSP0102-20121206/20064_1 /TAXON_ID=38822 ORGANISM="Pteridomonas danica, Strain PT" /NCGR_SAMPLE_ID=MMETSP0102 /ASSEMBLY_ACC=CAM_ASM_000212 /LENGTH=70 /DNA_ID=CAMNT_0001570149 /DNA_START=269 /DNA_END=481 /DNA_ORIENTATION=+